MFFKKILALIGKGKKHNSRDTVVVPNESGNTVPNESEDIDNSVMFYVGDITICNVPISHAFSYVSTDSDSHLNAFSINRNTSFNEAQIQLFEDFWRKYGTMEMNLDLIPDSLYHKKLYDFSPKELLYYLTWINHQDQLKDFPSHCFSRFFDGCFHRALIEKKNPLEIVKKFSYFIINYYLTTEMRQKISEFIMTVMLLNNAAFPAKECKTIINDVFSECPYYLLKSGWNWDPLSFALSFMNVGDLPILLVIKQLLASDLVWEHGNESCKIEYIGNGNVSESGNKSYLNKYCAIIIETYLKWEAERNGVEGWFELEDNSRSTCIYESYTETISFGYDKWHPSKKGIDILEIVSTIVNNEFVPRFPQRFYIFDSSYSSFIEASHIEDQVTFEDRNGDPRLLQYLNIARTPIEKLNDGTNYTQNGMLIHVLCIWLCMPPTLKIKMDSPFDGRIKLLLEKREMTVADLLRISFDYEKHTRYSKVLTKCQYLLQMVTDLLNEYNYRIKPDLQFQNCFLSTVIQINHADNMNG